jgi:hypothetical protein
VTCRSEILASRRPHLSRPSRSVEYDSARTFSSTRRTCTRGRWSARRYLGRFLNTSRTSSNDGPGLEERPAWYNWHSNVSLCLEMAHLPDKLGSQRRVRSKNYQYRWFLLIIFHPKLFGIQYTSMLKCRWAIGNDVIKKSCTSGLF